MCAKTNCTACPVTSATSAIDYLSFYKGSVCSLCPCSWISLLDIAAGYRPQIPLSIPAASRNCRLLNDVDATTGAKAQLFKPFLILQSDSLCQPNRTLDTLRERRRYRHAKPRRLNSVTNHRVLNATIENQIAGCETKLLHAAR